jgi:hypothetical protein
MEVVHGSSLPYLRVASDPSYGPLMTSGVQLPKSSGERSSSALGRAVVAAPADPFAAEAQAAAHGGLWRQPYAPRSVLGLAVLVGVGGSRT